MISPNEIETKLLYIEEMLGISFVLLQAKIRRVSEAAAHPDLGLSNPLDVGDSYKGTGKTLTALLWALGNYYKHCDEWGVDVWFDNIRGEKETDLLKRSRNTRRIIERIGIKRGFGGMRTAYEFFEVDWTSDCTPLAAQVQKWAKAVYEKCANP